MVLAVVEDDFLVDHGLLDTRRQSPADAAALAGLDEVVLRAGVEGIFSIDKLGVQHHVALLRRFALEVGEPLPRCGILALGAEEAVDPAVFVLHKPHVIDINVRVGGLRHKYRKIPEAEVIRAIKTFSDGEEGFAVRAFHPRHHQELALVQDRAGVEGRIDSHALHQEGIRLLVEVVAPGDRRVRGGQHRKLVAVKDPIAAGRFAIAPRQQLLLLLE